MNNLTGCQAFFIPPWLLSIIEAKNLPMSTLANKDELSRILTPRDFKNFSNYNPFDPLSKLGPDAEKFLRALSQTVLITNPGNVLGHCCDLEDSAISMNLDKNGEVPRYIYDDAIICRPEHRYVDGREVQFDLIVVDDRRLGEPGSSTGLIIGIIPSMLPDDKEYSVNLKTLCRGSLEILSRYYGTCCIATTTLFKTWVAASLQ